MRGFNRRLVWYSGPSLHMRWLMIALLVSLAALLIAAAGVVRHIWHQRARTRSLNPAPETQEPKSAPAPTIEETGIEAEFKALELERRSRKRN
jgi:hypothetical protein